MYNNFEKWIEHILNQELPSGIIALNFNLYEEGFDVWSMELVGTSSFDKDDKDWACDEIFNTRDAQLKWEQKSRWEVILEEISSIISEYLEKGQCSEKLKAYEGIGIGFVDGDIKLLYSIEGREDT